MSHPERSRHHPESTTTDNALELQARQLIREEAETFRDSLEIARFTHTKNRPIVADQGIYYYDQIGYPLISGMVETKIKTLKLPGTPQDEQTAKSAT